MCVLLVAHVHVGCLMTGLSEFASALQGERSSTTEGQDANPQTTSSDANSKEQGSQDAEDKNDEGTE